MSLTISLSLTLISLSLTDFPVTYYFPVTYWFPCHLLISLSLIYWQSSYLPLPDLDRVPKCLIQCSDCGISLSLTDFPVTYWFPSLTDFPVTYWFPCHIHVLFPCHLLISMSLTDFHVTYYFPVTYWFPCHLLISMSLISLSLTDFPVTYWFPCHWFPCHLLSCHLLISMSLTDFHITNWFPCHLLIYGQSGYLPLPDFDRVPEGLVQWEVFWQRYFRHLLISLSLTYLPAVRLSATPWFWQGPRGSGTVRSVLTAVFPSLTDFPVTYLSNRQSGYLPLPDLDGIPKCLIQWEVFGQRYLPVLTHLIPLAQLLLPVVQDEGPEIRHHAGRQQDVPHYVVVRLCQLVHILRNHKCMHLELLLNFLGQENLTGSVVLDFSVWHCLFGTYLFALVWSFSLKLICMVWVQEIQMYNLLPVLWPRPIYLSLGWSAVSF